MAGIADGAHAHAIGLCLFDKLRHHPVACHHSETVVSIVQKRDRSFLQNLYLRYGLQDTLLKPVDIDGLETVAAVAFDAAAVAFH